MLARLTNNGEWILYSFWRYFSSFWNKTVGIDCDFEQRRDNRHEVFSLV